MWASWTRLFERQGSRDHTTVPCEQEHQPFCQCRPFASPSVVVPSNLGGSSGAVPVQAISSGWFSLPVITKSWENLRVKQSSSPPISSSRLEFYDLILPRSLDFPDYRLLFLTPPVTLLSSIIYPPRQICSSKYFLLHTANSSNLTS